MLIKQDIPLIVDWIDAEEADHLDFDEVILRFPNKPIFFLVRGADWYKEHYFRNRVPENAFFVDVDKDFHTDGKLNLLGVDGALQILFNEQKEKRLYLDPLFYVWEIILANGYQRFWYFNELDFIEYLGDNWPVYEQLLIHPKLIGLNKVRHYPTEGNFSSDFWAELCVGLTSKNPKDKTPLWYEWLVIADREGYTDLNLAEGLKPLIND